MNASEYIAHFELRPGDAIVSRYKAKLAGLTGLFHYVVFLGEGWAIHNQPETGVVMIPMEEVAESYPEVHRIERFQGGKTELQQLYARVRETLGKNYDLLHFNCESLANYLRFGVAKSSQVIAMAILTAIIVLAVIAIIIRFLRSSGSTGGSEGASGHANGVSYSI